MINLFLSILTALKNHGEITAATIFDKTFSKVSVECDGKIYDICITERACVGVNKDA
jgi:hypothetical protein